MVFPKLTKNDGMKGLRLSLDSRAERCPQKEEEVEEERKALVPCHVS